MADPVSVEAVFARYRPWAVINAGGYVKVDQAESDAQRCLRENTLAPTILALACIRHDARFVTFSSDLVFDGKRGAPFVESDRSAPLNVYRQSKADAEQRVLDADPRALVIRTSSFFGVWDGHNFASQSLDALDNGRPFVAANDNGIADVCGGPGQHLPEPDGRQGKGDMAPHQFHRSDVVATGPHGG